MPDPISQTGYLTHARVAIMRPIYWAIIAAILTLIVGLVLGVAGIFLAPILGGIALIALVIWLLGRKARDEPPIP